MVIGDNVTMDFFNCFSPLAIGDISILSQLASGYD